MRQHLPKLTRTPRAILPLVAILALTSCGSDGDSTAPLPVLNANPTFTVSGTVNFDENSTDIVLNAVATDPEGSAVTYEILPGGGDTDQFTLDAQSGELRFAATPDFEAPTDFDANNIYEIAIRARDAAGNAAVLTVAVTVVDIFQNPVMRRKGSAFFQPIYLSDLGDGSGRVLVVERAGRIRIMDPETGVVDPVDFADLRLSTSIENERGLLGFTLAPDYANSRTVYVNITNLQGNTEIRRYQLMSGRDDMIDPSTEDIILRVDQPFGNHNAGWIGFDANGYLIVPLGDGGGNGDAFGRAQDPTSLLGKVLRLDVTGDDFPADMDRNYAIPPGNAFTDVADGRPEIFAIGFRNPYRASFDPKTGDLLIADVGEAVIEEVSRLPMDDSSLNFGWRVKEGTQDFMGITTATLTPPVAEYTHQVGPRGGRSITGGYVYTGPIEALQNVYIFADFAVGNIWGLPVADMVSGATVPASEFQLLTEQFQPQGDGTMTFITSFGLDAKKNLYITTIGGEIFRLETDTP